MTMFKPPPSPSTPERAPWEDFQQLLSKMDKLIALEERRQGLAAPLEAAPGVGLPSPSLMALLTELVPESIGSSAIISFTKSVAAATQDELDRQVPFTGVVSSVLIAFPAGCHQLVEVRLRYLPQGGSSYYIVPTLEDSFIALDDVTVVFTPRMLVKAPGLLKVEWFNYDSLNDHSVSVIAVLSPTALEVKP